MSQLISGREGSADTVFSSLLWLLRFPDRVSYSEHGFQGEVSEISHRKLSIWKIDLSYIIAICKEFVIMGLFMRLNLPRVSCRLVVERPLVQIGRS